MKTLLTILLFVITFTASHAQGKLNCKIYRLGFYEYKGKHSNVVLYRDSTHQIEYNIKTDDWVIIRMNWTDECKYTFTFANSNDQKMKGSMGETMEVDIVSGDGDGYTYHSLYKKGENGEKEYNGTIVFLVTKLKNSQKKKIVDALNKNK